MESPMAMAETDALSYSTQKEQIMTKDDPLPTGPNNFKEVHVDFLPELSTGQYLQWLSVTFTHYGLRVFDCFSLQVDNE